MTIVHVSREYRGLGEAGGIKDVVHDLATDLAERGHRVLVFTPFYGFLKSRLNGKIEWVWERVLDDWVGRVWRLELDSVTALLVETPWFDRCEGVYAFTDTEARRGLGEEGVGYPTEPERNLSFQRVVAESFPDLAGGSDVLHAHDAHTAIVGGQVRVERRVLTVHNAAWPYQQNLGDRDLLLRFFPNLRDSWDACLLGGFWSPILYAFQHSRVFTVSPFYAQEILQEDGHGDTGLLGPEIVRRGLCLQGHFNGFRFAAIEPDPRTPLGALWHRWLEDPERLPEYKSRAKGLVAEELAVRPHEGAPPDPRAPWLLFHARLTRQKGVEEVLDLISRRDLGAQVLVMGQGEARYREALAHLAQNRAPLCYLPYYDRALLLHLFAASDFFLIPSVFEPCALTDLMAMYHGTIPIVRKTGGLQKVRHLREGLVYDSTQKLDEVVRYGLRMYAEHPDLLVSLARAGWVRTRDFDIHHIVSEVWLPIYQGLEPTHRIW